METAPLVSGIQTQGDYNVQELVEDIFVSGACNNISHVKAIGEKAGIGYFENGETSIGISRGIIIATGQIANAEGPNSATDKSGNFYDNSGDIDLDDLSTGQVKDAVGIEFDFEPLDSVVTFRYVFASEEYCEFVGSIYNDVFGFFISGPGISGEFSNNAANVALIPGSADYVSINSVNHIYNSTFYNHNELNDDAIVCGLENFSNFYHSEIEYDGFTQKLTAVLRLIPCETYHIRLVVSDVGDNFYDSAVFLEAESFNLGGEVEVSAFTGQSPANPSFEGCDDAYFLFKRSGNSSTAFDLPVNYTVSPVSTATALTDFLPLSGSIIIPAGSASTLLPVSIINDGLTEPLENIVLELDIPCACFTDTARMYIADGPLLSVQLPDAYVCENSSAAISPTINGGIPDYTYVWSDGTTGPAMDVIAAQTDVFSVTVYDACGNSASDEAIVIPTIPPVAVLSGQDVICEGDTAYLQLSLEGIAPWEVTYAVNGEVQAPVGGIWASNFSLPVTMDGEYELVAVKDAACEGYASGIGYVEVMRILVDQEVEHVSCFGLSDGKIRISLSGNNPPFSFFWVGFSEAATELDQLPVGLYRLVVTDAQGCQKAVDIAVDGPPPLEPVAIDCEQLEQGILDLHANGGTPPYEYSVVEGEFFSEEQLNQLETARQYALTIRDANGCTLEQDFTMPVAYTAMVSLPEEIELKFGFPYILSPQLNIPEALIANIRWTPDVQLDCFDCLSPEITPLEENTYIIRITDIFGCTGQAEVSIKIKEELDIYIPNAFSPNGDQVNDRFIPFANNYQITRIVQFQVFDRWGGQVFVQNDIPANDDAYGWDGSARGQLMDVGVYTYFVEFELRSGKIERIGGHVVLMR
ncbi:MAG TPA: choice-of-anchor L domain-containing protein [Saprospiraceae bacterium]|nr:choice-of-anchor L domain-containing protein [Saprospiraceae bacterium]HMQ81511.1 choice-of-anchor L domain-containing protein [Saprospiraceae bacterium]